MFRIRLEKIDLYSCIWGVLNAKKDKYVKFPHQGDQTKKRNRTHTITDIGSDTQPKFVIRNIYAIFPYYNLKPTTVLLK